MCRGPLTFHTPINIDQIIKNEKQEKMDRINEDAALAKQLSSNDDAREQEVIDQVLEASLRDVDNDDYNVLANVIEQSYYEAQQNEEAYLRYAIEESIKNETIHQTVTRLCDGQTSHVVKLVKK